MIINTPKIFIGLILLIFIGFGFFLYLPVAGLQAEFTINKGDSAITIAQNLKNEKLISSRYVFLIFTLLSGNDKNLKTGRYAIAPTMNITNLVKIFSEGQSINEDIIVTIPEGANIWEIDKKLFGANLISKEGDFYFSAQQYEGYLFPDTYSFKKDTSLSDIIRKMKNNFSKRTEGLALDKDIVIVASILEKEVKTKEDMEIVSGILWKRLEKKMPLQIDATVAYGVCREASKPFCDITQIPLRDNLDKVNSYNTYKISGLPIGPISNPGVKALLATLNPVESEYLYYLSATAEDSRTIFSKTATEHARNRAKYIK